MVDVSRIGNVLLPKYWIFTNQNPDNVRGSDPRQNLSGQTDLDFEAGNDPSLGPWVGPQPSGIYSCRRKHTSHRPLVELQDGSSRTAGPGRIAAEP